MACIQRPIFHFVVSFMCLSTQAIFRSYRYGQVKPVFVYRLVASGSMEEKIFRRQLNKRALAQGVGDDDHQARQFSNAETADLLDPEKVELEIASNSCYLKNLANESISTEVTATGNTSSSLHSCVSASHHLQPMQTDAACGFVDNYCDQAQKALEAGADQNQMGSVAASSTHSTSMTVATDGLPKNISKSGEQACSAVSTGKDVDVANSQGNILLDSYIDHSDEAAGTAAEQELTSVNDVVLREVRKSELAKWIHRVQKYDSLMQEDEIDLTEEEMDAATKEFEFEVESDVNPNQPGPSLPDISFTQQPNRSIVAPRLIIPQPVQQAPSTISYPISTTLPQALLATANTQAHFQNDIRSSTSLPAVAIQSTGSVFARPPPSVEEANRDLGGGEGGTEGRFVL